MQIKRGRPKKVKVEGEETLTVVHHNTQGSLNRNRIYRHKDGTSCLVTYSSCKDKPEEIICKQ